MYYCSFSVNINVSSARSMHFILCIHFHSSVSLLNFITRYSIHLYICVYASSIHACMLFTHAAQHTQQTFDPFGTHRMSIRSVSVQCMNIVCTEQLFRKIERNMVNGWLG